MNGVGIGLGLISECPEMNHHDKYATYKREASVGDNTIPFLISCSILLSMAIPQLRLSVSNVLILLMIKCVAEKNVLGQNIPFNWNHFKMGNISMA
eukprot:g3105.t1